MSSVQHIYNRVQLFRFRFRHLEDWFGKEDFRVVAFAFELVEEAYAFLVVDQVADSKPAPKTNSGSSSKRQESRLSFPQLLRSAGEPRPSTHSRARRSQS